MSIKEVIRRIDPEKEYNLSHITVEGLFPWVKNIRTVRKIVQRDTKGENMLKTSMTGEGRALDYRIKGKNIIKFLEKYGEGAILAVENTQTNENNKKYGQAGKAFGGDASLRGRRGR